MRKISLRTFYFGTWWALVVLTLLNALLAELVAPVAVAICTLASLPFLFPRSRATGAVQWRPLLLAIASLTVGIFKYSLAHNIADPIGYGLTGLLPFVLARKRDVSGNWVALLLVYLVSQTAVLVGQEAPEYLLFILFALAFVFNLNSAHLYFHLGAFEAARTALPRSYFGTFIYSTSLGLTLALALFFLFPRSLQWANPFGLRQNEKITGYTGTISLDGSNLRESREVMMRVETKDADWLAINGPSLYFRGNTVDRFDGVHWSVSAGRVTHYTGAAPLVSMRGGAAQVRFLKIFREPGSGDWLIYPGVLRAVVGPADVLAQLHYDENGSLARASSELGRFSYEVGISMVEPRPRILSTTTVESLRQTLAAHPERYRSTGELGRNPQRYLYVPETVAGRDYFRSWAKEVSGQAAQPTLNALLLSIAQNFHRHFKSTYQHEIPDRDSFEFFLSRGHEGHCEYFATATALYLRSLGIPTRIVLGFRGGTFNGLSRVLEVRDANAHAWVELFIPETGWFQFDPTPMVPQISVPTLWDTLEQYTSAARFWFERYVVQYNSQTQYQLLRQMTELGKTRPGSKSILWQPGNWRWLWIALALVVARVLFVVARRRRRTRRGDALPSYYLLYRKGLRARGLVKTPAETYADFHARATTSDPALLHDIDEALERDLYSCRPTSPSERAHLRQRARAK